MAEIILVTETGRIETGRNNPLLVERCGHPPEAFVVIQRYLRYIPPLPSRIPMP
jgi:hypothetical protein